MKPSASLSSSLRPRRKFQIMHQRFWLLKRVNAKVKTASIALILVIYRKTTTGLQIIIFQEAKCLKIKIKTHHTASKMATHSSTKIWGMWKILKSYLCSFHQTPNLSANIPVLCTWLTWSLLRNKTYLRRTRVKIVFSWILFKRKTHQTFNQRTKNLNRAQ